MSPTAPFTTGSLLVASTAMDDPSFARAVILIVDHDEEGAVGLILNRPTTLDVAAILPVWADLAADPQVVFDGGPVGPDSALALARLHGAERDEDEGRGGVGLRHLTADLCLVDLDGDPDVLVPRLDGFRVFAGYAGWAPEQLEDEIAQGAWHVLPTLVHDVFAADADRLYSAVMRRQSGDLRLASTFPDDPSMN